MIHVPSTTEKQWEVVIRDTGLERADVCRFLDAARAERYAHFHNRLRDLGIRYGTATARFAPYSESDVRNSPASGRLGLSGGGSTT